jgi:hypothetical protein
MITEATAATSVCVSIVLHESALDALDPTLHHLRTSLNSAHSAGNIASARVVIRDNASSAAYRRELQILFDAVAREAPAWQTWELMLDDANPGFGAAHNANLEEAGEAYLLVLNPDVELAEDAVEAGLRAFAKEDSVVALNPLCHRADGDRDYLCKRYPTVLDLFLRGFAPAPLRDPFAERLGRYEYRDDDAKAARVVELLSGACLLCRGAAFHAVKGFDPGYFLYFEDFDLALRLASHGELRFEPSMQATHHGGFASRKGWRHRVWFMRSAARFFETHGWRLR